VVLRDLQVHDATGFGSVPVALEWLSRTESTTEAGWAEAIPGFVNAARYVAQGQVLNSRFRRGEALRKATAELAGVRKRLIGRSGSMPPSLLRRANEWRVLIESEEAKLRENALEDDEIPQVFLFGNPVREEESHLFAGRRDIVRSLEAALLGNTQPPAILLHGARRMGKTSILCQLGRLLGPEFAPGTLDCQRSGVCRDTEAFLTAVARVLMESLARRHTRLELPSRESLAADPFNAFDDWLRSVESAMPEGLRALVCFDEYEAMDVAMQAGWGRAMLDYLRHIQQHRPNFALLFAGMRPFRSLGRDWTSRFVNSRAIRVSFLSVDEFRPILEQPIPGFNMRYLPDTLESLMRLTKGQPFLTQAVAGELVEHLNTRRRRDATPMDVNSAALKAVRSADSYFWDVWDTAGSEGQALLRLAVGGGRPPASSARSRLRDLDVLDDDGNLAVPLMGDWMRQAPLDG
jgi:hypothetical protein